MTLRNQGLLAIVAVLATVTGCAQQSSDSIPSTASATNAVTPAVVESTESPAAGSAADFQETSSTTSETVSAEESAEQQKLESAPATVVAPATSAPPAANLSASAHEIVKLAQAGVDESVMLSFVTNSPNRFSLSSDDIIYLNDLGISDAVVTAMIQRDQEARGGSSSNGTPAPSSYTNQVASVGTDTAVADTNATSPTDGTSGTVDTASQGGAPYNSFYDALSPYGNWIYVEGYGMCWQPTVVLTNPGWEPYCDRGYWVYSDCGWYWASDYTWGWAPFHYGRWFRHNHWGWCWRPDTVWGPAWVSWRYSAGYCGWAPLPVFGFTVGWNVWVPVANFCDRHPGHYRVPPHHVKPIFDHSVALGGIEQRNGRVFNKGIPRARISAVTHQSISEVRVHETRDPRHVRPDTIDQHNRSIAVYRPDFKQPATGYGRGREVPRTGTPRGRENHQYAPNASSAAQPRSTFATPHNRQSDPVPVSRNPFPNQRAEQPNLSSQNPVAYESRSNPSRDLRYQPDRPEIPRSEVIVIGRQTSTPSQASGQMSVSEPRTFPRQEQRPATSPEPRPVRQPVWHAPQPQPQPVQQPARTLPQAPTPAQRFVPAAPSPQPQPAPVQRQQPRTFNSAPERSRPSFHSAPPPQAPRMTSQPASPAVQPQTSARGQWSANNSGGEARNDARSRQGR